MRLIQVKKDLFCVNSYCIKSSPNGVQIFKISVSVSALIPARRSRPVWINQLNDQLRKNVQIKLISRFFWSRTLCLNLTVCTWTWHISKYLENKLMKYASKNMCELWTRCRSSFFEILWPNLPHQKLIFNPSSWIKIFLLLQAKIAKKNQTSDLFYLNINLAGTRSSRFIGSNHYHELFELFKL